LTAAQLPYGIDEALAEHPADGQDGAELYDYLEQLALLVIEVQQLADDDQMARAGDRQELGQAFDDAQDQGLE